jgi:transporter family protein
MSWQLYALAGAFFAALTSIFGKLGVRDVDSHLATAIRTVVVLLLAWAIVIGQGTYKQVPQLSQSTLKWLVLSGLATGASWLCFFRALQMGPASQVVPLDKTSLALTVLLAAVFLREKLGWQSSTGVALMLAGALLLSWPRS